MIHIIGIGYKPLDQIAESVLLSAEYIVASPRLEQIFERWSHFFHVKDKLRVINSVDETLSFLKVHIHKSIVLLASGDPLFHGIGRRVVKECGKGNVNIYPEISCLQAAFSKIKETWDDALLISLHGGLVSSKHKSYAPEDIPSLVLKHPKIAILTDPKNNPGVIARILAGSAFCDGITLHVCQRLGYEDETILSGTVKELEKKQFREPNVVIIIRDDLCHSMDNIRKICLGLKEADIAHKEGLITKDEVRAVIIHKLTLPETGVMWDIGAGSGSVSLEAANMARGLRIYAVEKDSSQCSIIKENIDYFDLHNITLIEGNAPEALDSLPSPDRVFIGGSNGNLERILDKIIQRAGERITIALSASMIETLHEALELFSRHQLVVDCSQISVSRMAALSRGNYFKPLNPIFVVRAER